MRLTKTNIDNCYLIKINYKKDTRGYFSRLYSEDSVDFKIKQINCSFNKIKGTLRGFHYQKMPSNENKIIYCLEGEIFNVVVDLRKKSKTYKKVFTTKLKKNNSFCIHIPAGCANCFLTIKNNTKIVYLMSDFYKPKKNLGFHYKKNFLKIKWPIEVKKISNKDRNLKAFY